MTWTGVCAGLLTALLMLGGVTARRDEAKEPVTANDQHLLPDDPGWCEERRWVMGTQLRIVREGDMKGLRAQPKPARYLQPRPTSATRAYEGIGGDPRSLGQEENNRHLVRREIPLTDDGDFLE